MTNMTSSSLTPMQQYLARMPQNNNTMTLSVASSLAYPSNSSSHLVDTYQNKIQQQQQQQQHHISQPSSAFIIGPKAVSPSPSCNIIENDNNNDPMDESEQPTTTAPNNNVPTSFTDNHRRMNLFEAYALQQKREQQMNLSMSSMTKTTSTPAVRTASCLNEFIALQKKSEQQQQKSTSPLHHSNGNINHSRISTPSQPPVRSVAASSPSSNYLNAFLVNHKRLDSNQSSQNQNVQHFQQSISSITRSDDSSYMSIREQPSSIAKYTQMKQQQQSTNNQTNNAMNWQFQQKDTTATSSRLGGGTTTFTTSSIPTSTSAASRLHHHHIERPRDSLKYSKSQPHISLMEVPPCRPQREPSPTRSVVPSHPQSGPIGSIHPSSSRNALQKTSSSTSKSSILIVNMKVMHDMQPPNKKSKLGSFNRTSKNRLDRWNSGSVINGANGSFASKNKVDSIPLIPGSKRSYVPVSEMKNTLWDNSSTNMSTTTTPSTTTGNNNDTQSNNRMDIYTDCTVNTNHDSQQQLQRIRSTLSRNSVIQHVSSGLNLQSNRNSSFTLNNTSNHQLLSNHNSPFIRCESKNDIAPRIPSRRNW